MDIKELDKKQLILLTLLITFIVSIATGIITVSLMNQMPKSVPQTINNVIQRTIERVSTPVEVPAKDTKVNDTTISSSNNESSLSLEGGDVLVPIYLQSTNTTAIIPTATSGTETNNTSESTTQGTSEPASIGQGVIISDIGLILVDSSILTDGDLYKVVLNKIDFNASVLKKFSNGFTILKISAITDTTSGDTSTSKTQ